MVCAAFRAVPFPNIQQHLKKVIRLIRHRIIIDEGYVAGLITELIALFELLEKQVSAFIQRYENEHVHYDILLPPGASGIPL